MFNSNLYKKYFPIKSIDDLFKIDLKDLKTLGRWVSNIQLEMDSINFQAWHNSRKIDSFYICLLKTNYKKNPKDLEYKIYNKDFYGLDIDDLIFINNVLYRHKYNWFISSYQFPIIRDHKTYLENFFLEEKTFLEKEEFDLLMEEELKKCPMIYRVKELLI